MSNQVIPNLYTIRQFSEKHQAFSYMSLRNRIFLADKNNLNKSGAILRIGSRVLIDENKFFEWLLAQQV